MNTRGGGGYTVLGHREHWTQLALDTGSTETQGTLYFTKCKAILLRFAEGTAAFFVPKFPNLVFIVFVRALFPRVIWFGIFVICKSLKVKLLDFLKL